MNQASVSFFSRLDRWWFFPVLCALLLAPHFYRAPTDANPRRLALPGVFSGDEPHYLVALHSLLDDRDFDLKNNYDAARRGGLQAGRRFAGQPLDHHAGYYVGDRFVGWPGVFDVKATPRDDGRVFHYAPGVEAPELADRPEYSIHPPGLPLLLATVLRPWRASPRLEAYALLTTWIVTCVGAGLFRQLLVQFGASRGRANALTALLCLATPVWHYDRTLFCEPYLLTCATAGFYAVLATPPTSLRGPLIGGLVLAIGLLMKPPFALLAVPLGIHLLTRRRHAAVALFGAPLLIAAVAILVYNQKFFGSIWHAPQPWRSGNLLTGLIGQLFDREKGLLLLAPVVMIPLLAWPYFIKRAGRPAVVVLAGIVPYFLLMALWRNWDGGFCYGPRLIVPLLPLLFLPLAVCPVEFGKTALGACVRWSAGLVVAYSFAVSLGSVVFFTRYWNGIPWHFLLGGG